MPPRALALLAALPLLAACSPTTSAPGAPPAAAYSVRGVTPAGFRLPEGAGCKGDVARWRAIQDNDLKAGHVNQSVYDAIAREIAAADAACAAGREAEARSLVLASRRRHGYP